MPVYNRAHQIKKCLDSILEQSYSHYEIILVNDGSTDNLKSVLEDYKPKFRFKLEIINQANAGATAARNRGARHARGEFVLFCDADIIMKHDMLQEMRNALRAHPEASYTYSSFIWVKKKFICGEFDENRLKQMPYIHTTSLIRRNDFPGFDENIKRLQDWDLWLTMLEQGHTGVWIDEVLFRKQSGGTMSSWLPSIAYKILPFLPQVKKYKKAVKIIKEKHNLL